MGSVTRTARIPKSNACTSKQGTYRPQPVKHPWIAKAGSNKMRPLSTPVLEDKIAANRETDPDGGHFLTTPPL